MMATLPWMQAVTKPANFIADAVAPHWQPGQRHALALALAGAMRKAGHTQTEAEEIVRAVCAQVGDEESADRLRAVADTFARPMGEVAGARALIDLLDVQPAVEVMAAVNGTKPSVADLAAYCGLPADFLRGLGLRDHSRGVAIPYRNAEGKECALRLRTALRGGNRFVWAGGRPAPYGLDRLTAAKETGWLLIVEGESDCWTAWHAGLPALGVPGAAAWRREWAAAIPEGVAVFVWQEPGAAGARFAQAVARDVPGARIITGAGAKDLRDLWRQTQDSARFRAAVDELRARALAPQDAAPARETCAGLRLVRAGDVPRESVRFLVYPYVPRGEITLLEGDPGVGKSWVWMALAAGLTGSSKCRVPFDNTATREATVVVLTAEDDPARTLRPRLEELGADLERVFLVQTESGDTAGTTAASLDAAVPLLQEVRPDLIIVDPITLYVSGARIDMASANEVRAVLRPLLALARELDCGVLAVRHFRKATGRAIHRGLGSIDFTALARSILTVGVHNGQRVLTHAKSNLAAAGPALAFALGGVPPLCWQGVIDGVSADDVTGDCDNEERSALAEACDFLRSIAAQTPVKELLAAAKSAGISTRTLRRAKDKLGWKAEQTRGEDGRNYWCWAPPDGQIL